LQQTKNCLEKKTVAYEELHKSLLHGQQKGFDVKALEAGRIPKADFLTT
jgi:hypothetical protein